MIITVHSNKCLRVDNLRLVVSGNEAEFICFQCEGDYSPFSPLDVESFCANFDSTRDEIFTTEYDRLDTLVFCPFGQRPQEVDAINTSDLNSLDVNVSDPVTTITNYYSTPDFNGVVNNQPRSRGLTSSPPPPGAREERPWLGLFTCLLHIWNPNEGPLSC